jgi:hypothetical protein
MSRKEDRLFHAKDVWRIYCNYLNEAEKLKFKKQFERERGNCGYEKDPCEDVNDELEAGGKIIAEFQESVSDAIGTIEEVTDSLSDGLDDVRNFLDTVSDEIDSIRRSNNESLISDWDGFLVKLISDPIERAETASHYARVTQSLMLGGFAKSSTFAESLLRKQGLWGDRGTAVVLAKRKTAVSGGLTLAFIGFIGSIYKAFVEDCVKEK